jgi:hypothetical protein
VVSNLATLAFLDEYAWHKQCFGMKVTACTGLRGLIDPSRHGVADCGLG